MFYFAVEEHGRESCTKQNFLTATVSSATVNIYCRFVCDFSQCSIGLPAQGRSPEEMAQARGCSVPAPAMTMTRLPTPTPHPLSYHPCDGGLSRRHIKCHCVWCGGRGNRRQKHNTTMDTGQCGMHCNNGCKTDVGFSYTFKNLHRSQAGMTHSYSLIKA